VSAIIAKFSAPPLNSTQAAPPVRQLGGTSYQPEHETSRAPHEKT